MTKQVRDWNKDMTECESMKTRTTSFLPEIGIHWLQQYAAEKERADRLESELETAYNEVERLQKEYAHLDETAANDYDQLTAAEARERQMIALLKKLAPSAWNGGEQLIESLLASLYPKEEEAK